MANTNDWKACNIVINSCCSCFSPVFFFIKLKEKEKKIKHYVEMAMIEMTECPRDENSKRFTKWNNTLNIAEQKHLDVIQNKFTRKKNSNSNKKKSFSNERNGEMNAKKNWERKKLYPRHWYTQHIFQNIWWVFMFSNNNKKYIELWNCRIQFLERE